LPIMFKRKKDKLLTKLKKKKKKLPLK